MTQLANRYSSSTPLVAFAASLAAFALMLGVGLAAVGLRIEEPLIVACLAALAALGERGSVRLSAAMDVSISVVPTLFAAVLFGPLAGMIVAAASMLLELRVPRESPHLRWAIYTTSRAITGGVAGLCAMAAEATVDARIGAIVLATIAGAAVSETCSLFFAALAVKLRAKDTFWSTVRTFGPMVYASVPLYAPIVAILVISYRDVSPWTLPLFLVPAAAAHRLHVLYQGQRTLADDVLSANRRLERANLSFATALVATLDARDRYTAGHSAAVAEYARDIATRMGLSEDQQRLAHVCGLVHDIGKIGLPAGLLEKRGPLSLRERRQMEQHSVIGERILAKVEEFSEVAAVVRHHHERVDGEGYPDGLRGTDIPLISRIIAVADAYDAMTSDRPYRDAMPTRVARLRLAQAVGSQFDTAVVAAFEAILASADEDYRLGRHKRVEQATSTDNRDVNPPLASAASS